MALFNPMVLIALAKRSVVIRWLLGLHNFSLMPTHPGQDPLRRLQVRMVTTLVGILAMLLTLLTLAIAGIAAALAAYRPAAWILIVGAAAMLLLAARALLSSMINRLPTPGVIAITVGLDAAALAGGITMLLRM